MVWDEENQNVKGSVKRMSFKGQSVTAVEGCFKLYLKSLFKATPGLVQEHVQAISKEEQKPEIGPDECEQW